MSAEVFPTKHLLEKLQARDVTWGEIVDIVNNPEVVYGPDAQGRKVVQKGDLSVVVARDGAVITVVLRATNQWNDDHARNRKGKKN